jgi:transposase-like protein
MKTSSTSEPATSAFTTEDRFDPIEAALRGRIKEFIEGLVEREATAALERGRYERGAKAGYRHGTRPRRLLGSFGPVELSLPRVRLTRPDGKSEEWHSAAVPRYARRPRQVEALIASAYLSGTNTGRVMGVLFKSAVGKDVVSRAWRKLKADWEAWGRRDLAGEDILRLILDGTVVKVRLDRKATNISLLVVLGVRNDGQKVLLSIRNMGGESEAVALPLMTGLPMSEINGFALPLNPDCLVKSGIRLPSQPLMWESAAARCCKVSRPCRGTSPRTIPLGRRLAAGRRRSASCSGAILSA